MRWVVSIARVLLALPLLIFGLDGLLEFLPRDVYPEQSERGQALLDAFVGSGYLWPLLKGVEIAVAVALLTGRFVPLALVALAPIALNILLFHIVLEREGLWLGVWVVGLGGFLAWAYRTHFRAVLAPNAQPRT